MFIGQGVRFSNGVRFINDVSATPAAAYVTTGLQVNLLSAPTSGITWTDASGNGRNATLQGSATYVSTNSGGIKLPNTDYTGSSYISVPYNISTNTATVEIVASFNNTSHWATIWGNEIYNTSAGYMAYMTSTTSMSWGKPAGSVASITASDSVRHWTFVINGTNQLLYLNGSQLGTTTTVVAQTTFVTSEFLFGARHTNSGTGATDKLNNSTSALQPVFYQMRIYNKALSAAEVTQNYTAIRGTYGI